MTTDIGASRCVRVAVVALALALAAPLGGCVGATTQVQQGVAPTTGNADYDAFFEEVVDASAAASKAADEEVAARAELAKALGLDATADLEATVTAAEERAKKLKDSGIQLHLQLTPEPRLVRVEGTIPLDGDGKAVLKAVESSAKSSLELSRRLGALPEKLDALEKRRAELKAQADVTFKTEKPTKRRDIQRELEAAAEVISNASETSVKFAGLSSKFVLDLARAVETGGSAAALAQASSKASPAAPSKPVPKWKGAPRPPGAAAAKPASAPPPKKPAAGGDDFDP